MRISQLVQVVREATHIEGFDVNLVQNGKRISNLNATVADAISPNQKIYLVRRIKRSATKCEENVLDMYETFLEQIRELKLIRDMATKRSAWAWEQ